MVHKILLLLDPANKILRAESTDLYTCIKLVHSVCECVHNLRCDSEFNVMMSKKEFLPKYLSKGLQHFVTLSNRTFNYKVDKNKCKILFFSTLDTVIGEILSWFNERNSQLVKALCALDPGSSTFGQYNS